MEVTGDRLSGVRLRSGQIIPRRAVVIGPQIAAAVINADLTAEDTSIAVAARSTGAVRQATA
ncbi:MAG TPA: hypothetical protein VME44_27560 [Streptosporangiaceae bacterium]|nr:hypothetical protein [Streptosporangiaceae bacterium]